MTNEQSRQEDAGSTSLPAGAETLEELEEEVREENPDAITEREAFELALMEEGRSAEGAGVQLEPDYRPHGDTR